MNATVPKTRLMTAQNLSPELTAADQLAYWQQRSDIEALDQNHYVLIVRTNDAERPLV